LSSFSQRHAPPPRALGPDIPVGVRRAVASWFHEQRIDPEEVQRRFFQRYGYGDVQDVADDIRDRWGDDARAEFLRDLRYDPDMATYVFRHLPAPLYLDYVEMAVEMYVEGNSVMDPLYVEYVEHPLAAPVRYLNELFALRRIDYRFDENGKAEWHGDEGAYHDVIRPALDALADERLAACREELEAALGHLRAGSAKDREDAIEEAGKSVESAMKVLLTERGIERAGNETAQPLWKLLRDNGVVPPKTQDAILAPSRLRNEYGGHGAGEAVRDIPEGIPEIAVRSAAAAIAYLAALLP
jgi:hypothetical protein